MTDYRDSWDADRNDIPDSIQLEPVTAPPPTFGEPVADAGLPGVAGPIGATFGAPGPEPMPEPPVMPTPPPADADEATMAEYQRAMMAYEQRLSLVTSMLTNVANMKHEELKAIAQNLRG
jgi:hypothetical protein